MTGTPDLVGMVLSRWSITVQGGVIFVLFAFFAVAWALTRRKVLLTWTLAWAMDALAMIFVYHAVGINITSFRVVTVYVGYGVAKLLFGLFMVLGLYQYRRASFAMEGVVPRWLYWLIGGWILLLFVLNGNVIFIQIAVYFALGLLLMVASLDALSHDKFKGVRILASILILDAVWFLHHSLVLLPVFWGRVAPDYMSHISFVDAIFEFAVGLACLLAAGLRAMDEMWEANKRLEFSQQALRNLVDADPLTGLYNRRKFRGFMGDLSGTTGILIFMDVDKFKSVNDNWGHAAGDLSLRRVADMMRQVFRAEDGLFRMGGDEFLAVAFGLSHKDAKERIARLRELLAVPDENGIPIFISAGISEFGGDTPIDEALAMADSSMYENKSLRRRDSSTSIRIRGGKTGNR
ncbi:MAG: GGDEF domain-containing protein [Acidobacteria bacterium]|nr:GGDEF domain-containing protein [Acidobacteriota bacterium]